MSWSNSQIALMPRRNSFPFRVQQVYYCLDWVLPIWRAANISQELIEICFRLRGDQDICKDEIAGKALNVKFPHILIKQPGCSIKITEQFARDVISFSYSASQIDQLKSFGLLPEKICWELELTATLEQLLNSCRHCLYNLYTPGCPERLDWVCFQLLKEAVLQYEKPLVQDGREAAVIKNIALWMQHHCCENISISDIARRNNMSSATFYREWQRYFSTSPLQYIIDLRLEYAADMLQKSNLSIAQIVRNTGFCNATTFHHKFKSKYGMTPAQYRKQPPA